MAVALSPSMTSQKAPSAKRCIKTFSGTTASTSKYTSQKAPSAIRCIKTQRRY
ncbi:hypothetical protein HMPREF1138_0842 [Actinomyces sp. ICM58]|nr:hypothetical protein HMPREF1138_0842 [Actinomyces sp. ICM58]